MPVFKVGWCVSLQEPGWLLGKKELDIQFQHKETDLRRDCRHLLHIRNQHGFCGKVECCAPSPQNQKKSHFKISKVETVISFNTKQQVQDEDVSPLNKRMARLNYNDGNFSMLKMQFISMDHQLNKMLLSQQQLESAQQQLVNLLGKQSAKLSSESLHHQVDKRRSGSTRRQQSQLQKNEKNKKLFPTKFTRSEKCYSSSDSGHVTENEHEWGK